ncbi:MAG: Hsp20/alpha crystallin family protein [Halofilum sp. (in: g-proteobacteria)]|nr:Hsp20/alpha crystallin family protein [Halofilum sp. (in: g-proteobacteria)]MDZ7829496.1 Hsp20/alpha crystallin family protein [Halofilum sp. (in: g-proteobacteria)]
MLGGSSNVATSDWVPVVDIKEEKDRFVLHADLPGVKREDIDITMEDGVLSIRGERRLEEIQEEGEYKRIERAYGSFYRRFSLPDTADADNISARSTDGVLEVVIPKRESVKPRRIEIGK